MSGDNLRDRIAAAIHRYDNHQGLSGNDMPSKHHYGEANAVLAVVRAELDRLAAGVPLVCSDERHEAKVRGLEAERDWLRGERAEFSRELEENRAAVERARAVVDRLDGFAEATASVPDRSLYLAIADALRTALDGPATPAEETPRQRFERHQHEKLRSLACDALGIDIGPAAR